MTNKALIFRFIKVLLLIPISLVILSSCDIIDNLVGGANSEPEIIDDYNFSEVTKVEVEFLLDISDFKLTYTDGTDPEITNGGQHYASFTSLAGDLVGTGATLWTYFYGTQILGQTISGEMKITKRVEGRSINDPRFMKIEIDQEKSWNSSIFGNVIQTFTVNYIDLPFYQTLTEDGKRVDEFYESGSSVIKINTTFKETNILYTKEGIRFSCGAGAYFRVKLYYK